MLTQEPFSSYIIEYSKASNECRSASDAYAPTDIRSTSRFTQRYSPNAVLGLLSSDSPWSSTPTPRVLPLWSASWKSLPLARTPYTDHWRSDPTRPYPRNRLGGDRPFWSCDFHASFSCDQVPHWIWLEPLRVHHNEPSDRESVWFPIPSTITLVRIKFAMILLPIQASNFEILTKVLLSLYSYPGRHHQKFRLLDQGNNFTKVSSPTISLLWLRDQLNPGSPSSPQFHPSPL